MFKFYNVIRSLQKSSSRLQSCFSECLFSVGMKPLQDFHFMDPELGPIVNSEAVIVCGFLWSLWQPYGLSFPVVGLQRDKYSLMGQRLFQAVLFLQQTLQIILSIKLAEQLIFKNLKFIFSIFKLEIAHKLRFLVFPKLELRDSVFSTWSKRRNSQAQWPTQAILALRAQKQEDWQLTQLHDETLILHCLSPELLVSSLSRLAKLASTQQSGAVGEPLFFTAGPAWPSH